MAVDAGRRWAVLILVGSLLALGGCASAAARSHAAPEAAPTSPPITVVGDSLSILGRDQVWATLDAAGWTADISAWPGRSTRTQMEALRQAARRDERATIIELGTNDALAIAHDGFTSAQERSDIKTALDLFGDRCVVWINADRDPERQGVDAGVKVDAIIAAEAAHRPNVHVADFGAVLAQHPEYFVDDRVHLTAAGYQAMATLMADAVEACR
jgi:lysophospholipase L1-like esterase